MSEIIKVPDGYKRSTIYKGEYFVRLEDIYVNDSAVDFFVKDRKGKFISLTTNMESLLGGMKPFYTPGNNKFCGVRINKDFSNIIKNAIIDEFKSFYANHYMVITDMIYVKKSFLVKMIKCNDYLTDKAETLNK